MNYFSNIERLHDARVTSFMGKVTEDVLPPQVLENVLHSAKAHKILPLYWYYQALKVDYVFEHDNMLICKIHLPILNDELFNLYDIHSFPLRKGDTYFRVYHDVQIALSSVNGDAMFAENCIGRNPVVCNAAARYEANQFTCIHGLINNDKIKQRACPVERLGRVDPIFFMKQIGFNRYVGFMQFLCVSVP